ncbi:MAG: aminotransferase class V-fold PLP-dependent enzyme, partial [Lachnospiraceae bacterium]|nr:aminotransferase class V-fold PLP-dependent enzyme [Lachnospiraceae bacterium]
IIIVSFPGVRADVLLHALDEDGIYVSSGSACASNHADRTSGTLRAIGLPKELLDSTLRFSMSVFTTQEELAITLEALSKQVPILKKFSRK